jgi:hypothetical protein
VTDDVAGNVATVKLVDAAGGNPLKEKLEGIGGSKPLSGIVRGKTAGRVWRPTLHLYA